MAQATLANDESGLMSTGLTVRTRAVLDIQHLYGVQSLPDLAAKRDITRQDVQWMVNDTVVAGFVRQNPNPRHKRSPLHSLTVHGCETIGDITAHERAPIIKIGSVFSEKELSTAQDVTFTFTARL